MLEGSTPFNIANNQSTMKQLQQSEQIIAAVNTRTAAAALDRKVGTLRLWACKGGPIQPTRINGRLAWKVEDINQLLANGSAK